MPGWQRIRNAGNKIAPIQRYDHQRDEPVAYHYSNIITDLRFVLCDTQMSNELDESTPKG